MKSLYQSLDNISHRAFDNIYQSLASRCFDDSAQIEFGRLHSRAFLCGDKSISNLIRHYQQPTHSPGFFLIDISSRPLTVIYNGDNAPSPLKLNDSFTLTLFLSFLVFTLVHSVWSGECLPVFSQLFFTASKDLSERCYTFQMNTPLCHL